MYGQILETYNENNLNNENNEINIIKEVLVNNSPLVPINPSYNEFKYICKIEINTDNKIYFGSGFFIKLDKNNKPLFCLMSNEHIIKRHIINKNGEIKIIYNNEENIRLIKLTQDRFIKDYSDIGIDATIVEILDKDNINKDYFISPMYYDNQYDYKELVNKNIYIPQFPGGENAYISIGKIKTINQNCIEFSHSASTKKGSSGSPILLCNTLFVIGIHKCAKCENDVNNNRNLGDFIWPIIISLKDNNKIININNNGDYYIGEAFNGLAHGKGKIFNKNNQLKFIGNFTKGKCNGKGIKYNEKGDKIYEGNYINDIVDGQGIYYFNNGDYYVGEFKRGIKQGKGIIYSPKNNNKKLEGYFENDKYIGPDKYLYENGDYYIGKLINGIPPSKGNIYNKNNNLKYKGDLVNGIPEGKGISFYENGNVLYMGDFVHGKYEGKGKKYHINNNLKYDGDWLNGLRHGKGKEYDKNCNKIYEGFFKEGVFIGNIH